MSGAAAPGDAPADAMPAPERASEGVGRAPAARRVGRPSTAPLSDPERGLLFGVEIPMVKVLGLVGEHMEPDYVRIGIPADPRCTNSAGHLHGGMLMTALDCALACVARSRDPEGTRVITVDMTTHFVAATRGPAVAEARCLRRGRSLAFTQGEIRDLEGRLLATATGTFKPLPRDASDGDG